MMIIYNNITSHNIKSNQMSTSFRYHEQDHYITNNNNNNDKGEYEETPLIIFIKEIIQWFYSIISSDNCNIHNITNSFLYNTEHIHTILNDIIHFIRSSIERQIIALMILSILLFIVIRSMYRFRFI